MYTRPNPSVTCWYIYIYYINIYIYTNPGRCLTGPAHLDMPGDVWCKDQTSSSTTCRCASPSLCIGVGYAALGCECGTVFTRLWQHAIRHDPHHFHCSQFPFERGRRKSSKHCETNYDRIVVVLTFRMMSTFFNFLSAGLLHKPFGFYRGHLKLASTVAGMPVMERASLMRLMHRLLHWGVPEETRLTWCVAQFRNESIIEDWSA